MVRVNDAEDQIWRTEMEGRTKKTVVKAHVHTGARVPCLHVSLFGFLFLLALSGLALCIILVQKLLQHIHFLPAVIRYYKRSGGGLNVSKSYSLPHPLPPSFPPYLPKPKTHDSGIATPIPSSSFKVNSFPFVVTMYVDGEEGGWEERRCLMLETAVG